LPEAEELAKRLFQSLDEKQRQTAHQERQFPEIAGRTPAFKGDAAKGLAAADMSDPQRRMLQSLVDSYAQRMPADVAATELAAVKDQGWDKIHFAFAGAAGPGQGYSYRVQGPTFVIEFLNIQNDSAGNPANHIARWDGSSWSALGSGLSGESVPGNGTRVDALAVYNGALYVGGSFSDAGGVPVSGVARWDGASWSALGSGVAGRVYALTVHDGALIAGGAFATAGGAPANLVARWDGGVWSPLGSELCGIDAAVLTLTDWNGDLFAGGAFSKGGAQPSENLARWNGSAWLPLAGGTTDFSVDALGSYAGSLIAAGTFGLAGGTPATLIGRGAHVGSLRHRSIIADRPVRARQVRVARLTAPPRPGRT
jgi:hypothetical protein